MRKVVAHLIIPLDEVVAFNPFIETIIRLRDKDEVLAGFFRKVAEEDAMLLGRINYQE